MAEVLVIGGGMAGVIAALSARRAGAHATVLRRAMGATALSSGAIDVAPDPSAPGGDLRSHLIPVQRAAEELARTRPLHPYAVLRGALPRMGEALAFAAEQLAELLAAPRADNALLPTPIGTAKPTALAQRSQLGADLAALPEKFAVVSFALRPDFDAAQVAKGLEEALGGIGRTVTAVPVVSELFRRFEDPLRTPFELAEELDDPEVIARLAEELKRLLPQDIGAALFPPVLGRRRLDVPDELSRLLGIPCWEVVSGTPSVPGVRLQEALDRALSRAGVDLLEGELTDVGFAGGPFLLDGRPLRADAVVLATGKYIGGGIVRRGGFLEPVFELPVFSGTRALRDDYVGDLLGDQLVSEHAAFRAGIRIDASLRPLGVDGQAVFPRLFAAGSVISGYDPAQDKSGLGVAIFTGYLAGEAAARAAEQPDEA